MIRRYMVYLALLTASIMLLLYIGTVQGIRFIPPYTWWVLPVIFFAISSAGHGLMVQSFKGKQDQFMIFFLLATTVKMLLYLGLLLLWFVLSGQILTMEFVVAFAILYVAVTTLDLFSILAFRHRQH